jgi:hypothetical protein
VKPCRWHAPRSEFEVGRPSRGRQLFAWLAGITNTNAADGTRNVPATLGRVLREDRVMRSRKGDEVGENAGETGQWHPAGIWKRHAMASKSV